MMTTSRLRPRWRRTSRRAIRSDTRQLPRQLSNRDGDGLVVWRPTSASLCEKGVGVVGRPRLVDHDAVAEEDDPVGPGRVTGLVGDEQPGGAGVAALAQQLEH